MHYPFRFWFFLIFFLTTSTLFFGQGLRVSFVNISPSDTVTVGEIDTMEVKVVNELSLDLNVRYKLVGLDATLSKSSELILAGDSVFVEVYFEPTQNFDYQLVFVAEPDLGLGAEAAIALRPAVFPLPDYRSTRNLVEEPLKQALKNIVGHGNPIGYSPARDAMFMTIDNHKVNGKGASQNTLECVYTGQQAVGYSNRSDAQNNYGFNTEHTFPQGTFNSNEPMRSDLHHIFPTTISSNSERGNKPFGTVSNPAWQVGGSRSNGSTFEPRPQQKGITARAMLYFLIRYQNYQNYVSASDEDVLKDWCTTYVSGVVEKRRNDDVEQTQGNRNPFIDYPQFVERISSFISNSPVPIDVAVSAFLDTLSITGTDKTQIFERQVVVVNTGNQTYAVDWDFGTLNVINTSWSSSYSNDSLPSGYYGILSFQLNTGGQPNVSGTLTLANSLQPAATAKVFIEANPGLEVPLGTTIFRETSVKIYPNPGNVGFCFEYLPATVQHIKVYDVMGRLVVEQSSMQNPCIQASTWNIGPYVIQLQFLDGRTESLIWLKD